MAGNIGEGLAFTMVSIFQCIPIHAAWTKWDGTVQAHCVNANILGWICAAFNITFDVAILVLPLPKLAKLAMSWWQKCQLLLMFSLGCL